jgi:prophage DNA circulation protein
MIPAKQVDEAAKIASLAADLLLATSNDQKTGRAGSDLRRVCGDMKAYAEDYIVANVIAPKLSDCFQQAQVTGATLDELNRIRTAILAETPASVVGNVIKQACVWYSLQQMATVIAGMTFVSREDVDYVQGELVVAFKDAEEEAADDMVQMVYQGLLSLHASVMFHLYQTAKPLPQMLDFEFFAIQPTLVQSYRLYADASRADELRDENKVVHPAFAPRQGRALSF